MTTLSPALLANAVTTGRKNRKISQTKLSGLTGINRALISRIESQTFTPSVDQLLALSEVLGFDIRDVMQSGSASAATATSGTVTATGTTGTTAITATRPATSGTSRSYNIAVAGTGYVGLSLAVLLAQHNNVTAVDIIQEKVDKLNNYISPIQDDYIEKYLEEAKSGQRTLNLTATTDGAKAYKNADFVIVAAPTNYDPQKNFFDCSAVESVLKLIKESTGKQKRKPTVVIKSTIPVGYTRHIREKMGMDNIIFSPEFLRESKALYDNLYPSRIIVSCDEDTRERAEVFAGLLKEGAVKEDIETLFMGYTEAEATKLFVNTYLALRVSYFNELDTYAEIKELNTADIIKGVCLDPRVGDYYNKP